MAVSFQNFIGGVTTNNPLMSGATTINSAGLADLAAISAGTTTTLVLDPEGVDGLPEIVTVTAHTGSATSATVSRGAQGTTPRQHDQGTVWVLADTAGDWNQTLLAKTGVQKGDLLVAVSGAATARQAVGTDGLPLVAASGETNGIQYAQLGTGGIADLAVTQDKLADEAVSASILQDDAVSTMKIQDGAVTADKMPDGFAPQAGDIKQSIASSLAGWLLLDGSAVSDADDLYPGLWAVAPAGWKSGTTLNLPNMSGRVLEGGGTVGATSGSMSHTLVEANLPSHGHSMTHTHSINHDHPNFNATTGSTGSGHSHTGRTHQVTIGGSAYAFFRSDAPGGAVPADLNSGLGPDGEHTHGVAINVPAFSGTSGSASSSTTGSAGSGTSVSHEPAALRVNFFVKT